jgi:hypothetical protein
MAQQHDTFPAMSATTSDLFYSSLPPTPDFDIVASGSGFAPVPDDWTVMVSDVTDSTGAIERGEYKSVNMVGAASIISVLNACDGMPVPFMFGGDGGVVVVPPSLTKAASSRLATLRDRSHDLFSLNLRAAAIPIADLRRSGSDVLVQKFSLAGSNSLAMFAGGGLALADDWLKQPDGNGYHLAEDTAGRSLDLTGLSCRWQPLASQRGIMLTLIVQCTGSRLNPAQTGRAFERILGAPIGEFAPVQDANLHLETPGSRAFGLERAALRSTLGRYGSWAWTTFTGLAQRIAERRQTVIGSYDAAGYRQELKANTDFRKFDGMLRMVIDVTREQAAEIEQYLNRAVIKGDVVFGTSVSDTALMTCLLFDLDSGLHVHFIDGADGGYTRAARKLKASLARHKG